MYKSFSGRLTAFLFGIAVVCAILLTGCSKKDNPIDSQIEAAATQDAAETIAGGLVTSDGGLMDQMADILNTPTSGGIILGANAPDGVTGGSVTKTYDSLTGWWTVIVSRERGVPGGLYYASYQRTYKHQFLNKNGVFQKNYITPNGASFDTAYTVNHQIVSGSGSLIKPRLQHRLLSLGGKWTVTNTNTTMVTMNTVSGFPFSKAAADTVLRADAIRTLNNELTLNFVNVKGPRGSGLNWHQKVSGTITGTYHALVTFQRGATYREKEINRTINITFGGQKILLDVGTQRFYVDAATGEIE